MQHALVLLVGLGLLLPVQAIEQTKAVKVSTVLKTQTSWDGQPLQYPAGDAEVTGMLIEIAPGGEIGAVHQYQWNRVCDLVGCGKAGWQTHEIFSSMETCSGCSR